MKDFKDFMLTMCMVGVILFILSGTVGCTMNLNAGDNSVLYIDKETKVDGNRADANIPLIP